MKIINARMGSILFALLSCVANAFGNAYVPLDAKAPEVNEVRALKEVLKDAKAIDAILAKGYSKNKVKPLPLADDATFVRRAHLQVGGRIPTYQETIGFLESNDPQKHSSLVDRILNSEAYDSHTFNWWADLLRIQSPSRSGGANNCLLYTSPSPRDRTRSRMPSSA